MFELQKEKRQKFCIMLSFTHEKRQFRICVRELGITEKVKKREKDEKRKFNEK